MICKQCGAKIDDNAAVCQFCGEVYEEIEETVAEETTVTDSEETIETVEDSTENIEVLENENESLRQEQMDRIRAEKQVRLEEIERRRLEKKRRQRRNKILIILLAVLCVGAVGLGAYYLTLGGVENDDVIIVTPRPTEASTNAPVVTEEPTETPEATVAPTTAPTEKATIAPAGSVATQKPVAKPVATKKPTVAKPAATKKPVANKASDFNAVKAKFGGGQIFANSSTTKLTAAQLQGLSKSELRVARNEIYARRGRGFSNSALQAYFNGCSWYKMDANYDYANEYNNLSSIEKANINLIKSYEAK